MDFKKLINKATEAGFSSVEVFNEYNKQFSMSLFNGNLDKSHLNESNKYSVRGIYDEKMAYLTFENDSDDIDAIIKALKENAKVLTTEEKFEIFKGSKEYRSLDKVDGGFDKVSVDEKLALLKKIEKTVKELDERVIVVPSLAYEERKQGARIVNSYGLDIKKEVEYGYAVVQVVVRENNDTQANFDMKVKLKFNELNPEEIAKSVVEKAIAKLNAQPVDSKVYPVIFDNEAMCSLLSGFSSMFSGEAAIKKLTSLIGKEGTKIMDERITICDDPFYPGSVNNQSFDDEGVACYQKNVVEKGVLKTLLHNLKTAKYFNTSSTGNGFKDGSGAISIGTINMYVAPGEKTQEEMISGIKEGLLIKDMAGLHAGLNPISGDFSAQSSGFLIENGKIVRPVNLIVVSGNFLKMMNDIDTIGKDLFISYAGVGSPSILFKGLTVSGK